MPPHEEVDLLAAASVTVGFLRMYMLENLILLADLGTAYSGES